MSTSSLSAHLNTLQEAIQTRSVLRLTYADGKGAYSERDIEPLAIYLTLVADWRLVAWCRLREDYREFNLERIQKSEVVGEHYAPRFFRLKDYFREG
ncbi:MAG: WYL domain-containing protein [Bacteroidota bacterium]